MLKIIFLILVLPMAGAVFAEPYNPGEELFLTLSLRDHKLGRPWKGNDLFFCDDFKGMYLEDFTGVIDDTVTRYDDRGNMLWKKIFQLRPKFSSDCRYVVMQSTSPKTEGYIYDGETGKLLVHSQKLLGYGWVYFSKNNRYIISREGYVEPDEFNIREGGAVTSVDGKRILFNPKEAAGEPVFNNGYFVGNEAVYDRMGKVKWVLDYNPLDTTADADGYNMFGFPIGRYPLFGFSKYPAERAYVNFKAFSTDGMYFVAEESQDTDSDEVKSNYYLGKWNEKGFERIKELPEGLYLFSDDSSKLAISTTEQLRLMSVGGEVMWEKPLIKLAENDIPSEYLSKGKKFSLGCGRASCSPYMLFAQNKLIVYYGGIFIPEMPARYLPALKATIYDMNGNIQDTVKLTFGGEGFEEKVHYGVRDGKLQFFLRDNGEYVRVHFKPNNIFEFYRGKLKSAGGESRNEEGKD